MIVILRRIEGCKSNYSLRIEGGDQGAQGWAGSPGGGLEFYVDVDLDCRVKKRVLRSMERAISPEVAIFFAGGAIRNSL